jgi:NTP pyrophosphatase (non-canonical NTP hydrolase)
MADEGGGPGPAGWSDAHTRLIEVQAALAGFNAARDWGQFHSPRNLAMALSVEAGELLALYLWSADGGPQPPVEARRPKVAAEAADVLICLLNLCAHAEVDLLAAVEAKVRANAAKYPVEAAQGRLLKYDELDVDPAR